MKSAVQWLVVKAGSHTRCGRWLSSLAADHYSVKKEISQLDGLRSPQIGWMKSAVQWLVVKAGSHTRCGWWLSSLAADHCSVKNPGLHIPL